MAAASNQLGGRRIESIVLCGRQQADLDLARAIEADLGIGVELFDPLEGVKLGRAVVESPPEHPGRFAPLVGMLLAELRPSKHAVDFLHPRRRAAAPNPRKKWRMAAALAATLLLAWLIYSRIDYYRLADSVAELSQKSKGLDKEIDLAKKVRASTAEIAKWADEDVVWLDRIYALEQGFPSAEEAALSQLSINSGPHGGQIELKGWVRRPDGIARLEEGMRAHGGSMSAKSSREDRSVPPYTCSFEASVLSEKSEKP
jgi:hypothetical protein